MNAISLPVKRLIKLIKTGATNSDGATCSATRPTNTPREAHDFTARLMEVAYVAVSVSGVTMQRELAKEIVPW